MSNPGEFHRDHALYVDELRTVLRTEINQAVTALLRAGYVLGELTSAAVYDIEFVEGADGADAAAFLADALRCARAAHRITANITDQH
jgi:hypothetical protein